MSGQQVGLISPFPVGLKSSSSPPGSGRAGNGGSPKQGPTPPDAATSKRDGGITEIAKFKIFLFFFFVERDYAFKLTYQEFHNHR